MVAKSWTTLKPWQTISWCRGIIICRISSIHVVPSSPPPKKKKVVWGVVDGSMLLCQSAHPPKTNGHSRCVCHVAGSAHKGLVFSRDVPFAKDGQQAWGIKPQSVASSFAWLEVDGWTDGRMGGHLTCHMPLNSAWQLKTSAMCSASASRKMATARSHCAAVSQTLTAAVKV